MADDKQRNPFEDHIESDAFDVSKLEHQPQAEIGETRRRVKALLDSLPQPLTHDLWDTHLDDEQKRICAHLSIELVERVLKDRYADELQEFNDEQLTYLLTVPVVVSMLAEERLHRQHEKKPQPSAVTSPRRATTTTTVHPLEEPEPPGVEETLSDIGDRLKIAGRRIKNFLIRLYERFTS